MFSGGAGGVSLGLLAAGASDAIVITGALIGGIITGLIGLAVVPPWTDQVRSPWVGGLPFILVGLAAVLVGLALRP